MNLTAPCTPDQWTPATLDRELIRKYDRPGPRYTSYPTAPNFQDFSATDYQGLLRASAESKRRLSLYLHMPFCRTLCFYCGCNVTVSRSAQRGQTYLDHLKREIDLTAAELGTGREVVQIHLGGGTPNFFQPQELADLFAHLRGAFRWHDDCEIGVEVDPRTVSEEHLDALAGAGVNRLSAGLQDLEEKVQKAINRVQPFDVTRAVVDGAHERGIKSVNLDLVYGLPHQTVETFERTLDGAIALNPERFAVFNFAYLPTMLPHQRVIDPAALPSAEEKLSTLERVIERLTGAGYVMIGMDHFARPEDPLSQALLDRSLTRNFQGYSTWGETDLVAFGASAIGFLGGGFAQNRKDVTSYQEAVGNDTFATCRGFVLNDEDQLRRDVIQELMCHFRLSFNEIEARHPISFRERSFKEYFQDALERLVPMAADGLIEIEGDTIQVQPAGQLLVRNVAMAFDGYLPRNGTTTAFSRTV